MDSFINLIWEYRYIIIFLIVQMIWVFCNPDEFKAKLYSAMLNAKQLAKDGVLKTGKEQEDYIVDNAVIFLGKRYSWLLIFIGEEKLRVIIKGLYDKALDGLDNGKFDGSVN